MECFCKNCRDWSREIVGFACILVGCFNLVSFFLTTKAVRPSMPHSKMKASFGATSSKENRSTRNGEKMVRG